VGRMAPSDTTRDASAVRTERLRQLGSQRRSEIALELSNTTREIAREGIRRRHPTYSEHEIELALRRLLVGDELFRRVWPREPLLAP
jgi:hypothetical protein